MPRKKQLKDELKIKKSSKKVEKIISEKKKKKI